MAVNLFDWTQYPTINVNNKTFYLLQNLDDNLCLAIDKQDTLVDDESAAAVQIMYAILVQLDDRSII